MLRRTLLKSALALAGTALQPGGRAAASDIAGFYLPEESLPHERTFMQWPVNRQVHPDPVFLGMLQQSIADIANTIAQFEPVVMLMENEHEASARKKLSDAVDIWDIATDDLWCRDSGPLFVVDGKGGLAVRELNFNGWGGKQVHGNDGRIARRVAERMNLTVFDNGIVGEAGGVETDGEGTAIAHESSWVNSNRNTGGKAEVEHKLLEALGAQKMIWAPGVAGADITDYHIDSLARFTQPGTVIIQMPEAANPGDPWSRSAFETFDTLNNAIDSRGRALELVTIPEPYDTRITSADFVASYVNYYVCNGAVIMAEFGDREADQAAVTTIGKLYQGREIITLNIDPIGETGGGIHCATREQPRV